MSIDPTRMNTQLVGTPTQFASEGAYGDYLNQMRPTTRRPKRQPDQVSGPFYETQSGVEILNPGQSAESIQTRIANAEKDAADKKDNKPDTPPTLVDLFTPATPTGGTTTTTTTANKVSAFDRLRDRLKARGLESLYDSIRGLIEADLPEEEFTIQLRQLPAYAQRFAANEKRVNKGLRPLSESQYLLLEDQYQDVMRRYGLPETYYARGAMGAQPGFEKFLELDVSPVELEDRIQTAQERVINASAGIKQAFQEFYPGITNGDILGYVLDPSKDTLNAIKRKATAAEIGAAARGSGLYTGQKPEDIEALRMRAEELGQAGVTQATAQKGFQTISELAPRGGQLAAIYKESPYTQTTAEQEVFGLAGSAEAAKQRKKLTQLETAAFSGQTGMGALARDRAGAF